MSKCRGAKRTSEPLLHLLLKLLILQKISKTFLKSSLIRNVQDGLGVVGQDVLERRRVLQVELVEVVDGHDEVVQRLRRDQIPLHRRGIRILDQPEPELLRQELEVVDQAKVWMDADQPDVDSNQGLEDQLQNRFDPLWKL